MFSSGKHAKLTADPSPWAVYVWPHSPIINASMRYATEGEAKGQAIGSYVHGFHPRPEFDRPLTNPENKILLRMRILRSDPDAIQAASSWIIAIDRGYYDEYPKRMRTHAREVLSRLARLADAS